MRRYQNPALHVVTVLSVFFLWGFADDADAQSFAPSREYEPLIVQGALLPAWVGADATMVTFYVYKDGAFVPIPFQYDKRRKIHVNFNVPPDDVGHTAENCELGYFRELNDGPAGQGDRANFASNALQSSDEFVFLLNDVLAGTAAASTNAWIASANVADDRYEISVYDPRTQAARYLYAFHWGSAPPSSEFNMTDYVIWSPENNVQACPPVAQACSFVRTNPTSPQTPAPGSIGNVAALDVHFGGNWITDALQLRDTGATSSSPHVDVLDRFKYFAWPQETEDTWSNGSTAEFLGYTDGRVRVVRAVQGAASGRRTTKYEFIYPTMFVMRVNLRVHDLPLLNMDLNHELALGQDGQSPSTRAYLWSQTSYGDGRPENSNNKAFDAVDGSCGANCFPSLLSYPDWVEMNSPVKGSYVHYFSEPRPMPLSATPVGARAPRYADAAQSSSIGRHGRHWENLACTEDGSAGGLSGCVDPEDPALYFARLEVAVVPQPYSTFPAQLSSVVGDSIRQNLQDPVQALGRQQYHFVPLPPPQPPCTPVLSLGDPHTGAASLQLGPSLPCGGTVGTLVYRAEGTGAYALLADTRTASSWTDYTTFPGVSYRYKVVAYNAANSRSGWSNEASLTPVDSTPPPAPPVPQGTGGSTSAVIDESVPCSRDILGVNVYMGQAAGGPYTKMNGTPIIGSGRTVQYVQAGLETGHTYYFVFTAVDFSGNESGYSPELAVHTGP